MKRWNVRRLLVSLVFVAAVGGGLAAVPRGAHRAVPAQPPQLRAEEPAATGATGAGPLFPALDLTAYADRASRPAVTNGITFGQPTIVGIQGTGFEPDIRLDPSDPTRAFSSVPGSLSSNDSWIWHTRDAGKTWKWVPASHPKVGKPVACAGGGDTELTVDLNGKVYFNDLTLANFSVARSDDRGTTWPCNNTGVPSAIVDRQWYATDGDPTALGPVGSTANSLYLASNNIGQGAPQCPVSGAGNNVLTVYRSVIGPLGGLQFLPSFPVAGSGTCDEGIMGNVEVSPKATMTPVGTPAIAPPGPVKHVFVLHDDASFSKIRIGRCFPVAVGPPTNTSDPSGLKCDDRLVRDLGSSDDVRTGANFPSLAIDGEGNLYAVWQQAPVTAGNIGDVSLRYSYSTDEGMTWSTPVVIPTPGLNNSVMTWAAAGNDGRVDISFYATSAHVPPPPYDPNACLLSGGVPPPAPRGAPDLINGTWSVYMVQTLNGHDPLGVTFTDPLLAGEHHNHRGSVATVMGGLCGDRAALGDFFKLRIGPQGEANIIYSDSNNSNGIGHTMFVRQTAGSGVFAVPASTDHQVLLGSATDPADDGIRELDSTASANLDNLDITESSLEQPSPATCHPAGTPCYRVKMKVKNLTLTPPPGAVDGDLVWLTQWLQPSSPTCATADAGCTHGGRNFHVYGELTGTTFRCFFGESSIAPVGGGVTMTYPPAILSGEITAAGACSPATGPGGTITIEVPLASVSLEPTVPPLDAKLYSVTASTMTLAGPSDSVPAFGLPPDVIDVARAYDFVAAPTAARVRSFRAVVRGGSVTVRWRTGSEVGLAGFQVYRGKTRLNRQLIRAHGGVSGHAYFWRGRVPHGSSGAFRLQLVKL